MADDASRDPAPLLLHVGYHKTGTTWLQAFLFNDAQAGFVQPWDRGDIIERLVLENAFRFDAAAARAHFQTAIDRAHADARIPVCSAERLSGNPHSGGHDAAQTAQRLRDTFPEARVLIVMREQRSMILSAYRQYVRVGGAQSLRRYLHPPALGRPRIPQFRWDYLEYDLLVGRYRDLFGAQNVLALPFETLKKDADAFAQRIARFAGAREPAPSPKERKNVGMSAATLSIKRRVNRVLVRDTVNPGAWFDHPKLNSGVEHASDTLDRYVPNALKRATDARLKRIVDQATGDRYAKSNANLASMLDTDLGALGYSVGSQSR